MYRALRTGPTGGKGVMFPKKKTIKSNIPGNAFKHFYNKRFACTLRQVTIVHEMASYDMIVIEANFGPHDVIHLCTRGCVRFVATASCRPWSLRCAASRSNSKRRHWQMFLSVWVYRYPICRCPSSWEIRQYARLVVARMKFWMAWNKQQKQNGVPPIRTSGTRANGTCETIRRVPLAEFLLLLISWANFFVVVSGRFVPGKEQTCSSGTTSRWSVWLRAEGLRWD